jgi:hypothetical protein
MVRAPYDPYARLNSTAQTNSALRTQRMQSRLLNELMPRQQARADRKYTDYDTGLRTEDEYLESLREDAEAADIQSQLGGGPGLKASGSYAGTSFAQPPRKGGSLDALAPSIDPSMLQEDRYDREDRLRMNAAKANMAETQARETEFGIGPSKAKAGVHALSLEGDEKLRLARATGEQNVQMALDPNYRRLLAMDDERALAALRARYTDPAIARGEAELERERVRAAGGVEGNRLRAGGQVGAAEAGAQGRTDAASIRALGEQSAFLPPGPEQEGITRQLSELTPPPNQKVATMDEVRDYAMSRGISEQEALAVYRQYRYTVR